MSTTGTKKKKTAKKGRGYGVSRNPPPEMDMSAMKPMIGFHLRRAMATMIRSYNRNVFDGTIRPGLASLLRLVVDNHGASQVDLSRALQIDKATLVSLIDTAEENGWLVRQRSTVDRRRHEVVPTPEGERVAAELARQLMKNEKIFHSRFTDEELAQLIEYLERIYLKPG